MEQNTAEPYLQEFEKFEPAAKQPSWVFPLRKAGLARFAEVGFPTLKHEDWRFTNVAPIAKLPFKPILKPVRDGLSTADIGKFTLGKLPAIRLVFVSGHYVAELSNPGRLPAGVTVQNLAQALKSDSKPLQRHLARHARTEDNAFTALNTAFFQDGAFVHVPPGTTLDAPIHLLFVSTANQTGAAIHPRNLIIVEKESRLTLLESYASVANATYVTNAVTELLVDEGAMVEHCKFQDESLNSFHIAAIQAHLGRNCDFISHSIATGAQLSRNNIRTTLAGEGLECVLNGLYLTTANQLADHHMIVEHAQPHCNSHEYYNGILDGRSKGVFHGRILVRQAAQKTDAKQTNKNLLLSDEATVDTKPQLEIYADDVKCTHGATIGQLNEESIFYLRARGIGAETARRMLIQAFAGEIIERIRHTAAREEMTGLIWERLEANPRLASPKS